MTYVRAVKKPTTMRSNHATDSLRALESYLHQEQDIILYLEPAAVTAPMTYLRLSASIQSRHAQPTKRLITDSGTLILLPHDTSTL